MNWLDIVLLCFLGFALIKGLYDGMIKQIAALAALIIGIYLCSGAAEWLHSYLIQMNWFPRQAVNITCYFLGFVLIAAIVWLAGLIVDRLVDATPLSLLNHLTGGLLGLLSMVVFLSFILNVIELLDSKSLIIPQETKVESKYYMSVRNIIPSIFPGKLFSLNS